MGHTLDGLAHAHQCVCVCHTRARYIQVALPLTPENSIDDTRQVVYSDGS